MRSEWPALNSKYSYLGRPVHQVVLALLERQWSFGLPHPVRRQTLKLIHTCTLCLENVLKAHRLYLLPHLLLRYGSSAIKQ